jgi:uncharacterized damage-inducible protein DinB
VKHREKHMNYEELESLLDYHYWARDRTFDAMVQLTAEQWAMPIESSFKSVRDTAVHMWAAELVWCARWQGNSPTGLQSSDTFPTAHSLRAPWQDLERNVRSVLRELGPQGIARRFEYKTLAGQPQSSLFWQMLQHVVNHASYHRGQLTTMLRQVGASAPKTMDLIAFYREREALLKSATQTT